MTEPDETPPTMTEPSSVSSARLLSCTGWQRQIAMILRLITILSVLSVLSATQPHKECAP